MQISLRKVVSCYVIQFGDNQSLWSFLALRLPCRVDDDVEYADNQSIICLVVCYTHGLCHSGMLSVFHPHYDIGSEISMFGTRMHL